MLIDFVHQVELLLIRRPFRRPVLPHCKPGTHRAQKARTMLASSKNINRGPIARTFTSERITAPSAIALL